MTAEEAWEAWSATVDRPIKAPWRECQAFKAGYDAGVEAERSAAQARIEEFEKEWVKAGGRIEPRDPTTETPP